MTLRQTSYEIRLTRAQRRQMKKLADKVDRITQTDRRFFERRPDRQHRVRLASQAEVEQHTIVDACPSPPDGYRLYVAVRNVAPGARLRQFLVAPEGRETDLSEAVARVIFEKVAVPWVGEVEADMRRMVGAGHE